MEHLAWLALPIAAAAIAPASFAAEYLSVEEAQRLLFPGATRFDPVALQLTAERSTVLNSVAAVHSAVEPRLWTAAAGARTLGYFALHDVIGKQDYITYAVALDAQGRVSGVEILAYRESHGYEIRNARWRAQFAGKGAGAPLKLEEDIVNISGATLSCRHVTDGVRRIVALVAMLARGN
jgi:Na+-translocating ferredoxin:NAD+ oxidoreductase RnfG subunit